MTPAIRAAAAAQGTDAPSASKPPPGRDRVTVIPRHEHSVPWFWPLAAGIELGASGLAWLDENVKFVAEVAKIEATPEPSWVTPNRVLRELDTMRVRDFASGAQSAGGMPVVVAAPYAGHSATIADFAKGQSLVETLHAAGLHRVLVTDWRSATHAMRDYDIDKYLSELNVVVDDGGGKAHLVGLCQGGWLCAMYAARFPGKVQSMVLAGAPIDTAAGDGAINAIAHELPLRFFENIVRLGNGRMLGAFMLAGWKSMHPTQQYLDKYLDLYTHIEDRNYLERTEKFERWYESPIDLPGRFYLQAIEELFKENRLAKGSFVALGRKIDLRDIALPLYLLAGEDDDITPREETFRAESLVGTAKRDIARELVPGGHIGLFMSKRTLEGAWPAIGRWIRAHGPHRRRRA
ncbi:MAG: alpha/beta fold hydrolase [Burkholderiales bacterium]|nr:alpha/beta fold hydrolase [Burkholderiales bacterium]